MNNKIDINCIPLRHLLSDVALVHMLKTLSVIQLPKNTILINDNKIEPNAYIIQRGIARAFIEVPDKEITFWFAKEGTIINSSAGYFTQEKGYENFQLLEDSTLLKIDMEKMRNLFYSDLEICNWARLITESEAIAAEKHHLDYIILSPEERYLKFLKNEFDTMQRVPLKDIATYLGISPVSLSRIRSRIK